MGGHERTLAKREYTKPAIEVFKPPHFRAAYIFDQPADHFDDIDLLIEKARELDYPVSYWWLSQAMYLQGAPDRLIMCVYHPSSGGDAGLDLFDALREKGATWTDLEAATFDEYINLGKPVSYWSGVFSIKEPDGWYLFPDEPVPGP